ncbi:Creatinine amidohydrolase/Fe(II)-dependent formamide hydrolase involved in riboflavin and F420 biosynthesis [Ruegeria halocynthiae]|uniref:Creatinine amidohydrolase/Fe(II)-dependent formamide hydrolase involved in riboflavin and F420 biosynthesis n=1 Tax=Ruegeria halocynthiae TaxID=985054 RepID=A0A1H2UJX2_9RHOB|nr:creatininase family protein [Ruegeria halocynthiae]SDW55889.1 Creatinine amidohydrolase/Fe(II)-dependent formamide hydrolase involved in riboflavin and F420 biosynthesis [Ruegeria halocynthiae]
MLQPGLSRWIWAVCIVGIALTAAGLMWTQRGPSWANKLFLERMTWPEVHAALEGGYKTVIIPTGGTEQNGPHVTLGKHNVVVEHTSREIAKKLGNTLIAPVIRYVPEGEAAPNPTGHMLWPGTISLPDPVFQQLLEATIRSLASHGFDEILLIGDSGGNQAAQSRAATAMNLEFANTGVTVQHVSDYYESNGQIAFLKAQGFSVEQIGNHAALRDTSELLYVKAGEVGRSETPVPSGWRAGFDGRPDLATQAIGKAMILLKVNAALEQIHRKRDENS